MSRFLFAAATVVACVLFAPAWAGDPAPSMNPADWSSDLDTLYAAMKGDHPNLHHRTSAAAMDVYVEGFHKAIPTDTWPEYVMGLYRLLALVGDGHTTFYPPPDAGPGFDTRLPLLTEVFADGVYVVSADPAYGDAVGGRLVAVGGRPLGDVVDTAKSYWPNENPMWVLRWLPFMLHRPGYLHGMHIAEGGVSTPVVFTVMKNGVRRNFAVAPIAAAADAAGENTTWIKAQDPAKLEHPTTLDGTRLPFDFVYLKKSRAVYAVYRECSNSDKETVAAFAKRLFDFVATHDIDKLAIDIRDNGGGDNYLNQSLILGMIRAAKIDRRGHLFVITGRKTFSAAQNFASDAERWT